MQHATVFIIAAVNIGVILGWVWFLHHMEKRCMRGPQS